MERVEREIVTTRSLLQQLIDAVPNAVLPQRGRRRDGLGDALVITDAIRRTRETDGAKSRLERLRQEKRNIDHRIERLEHRSQQKLDAIRRSQAEFRRCDCFALGFSREVLNVN